ncbi:MAG: hypothetical protein L0Y44_07590 [Phycisphaerales bacterium]|nr:hypothetical protein [Phycisphaerales bacterium]MCI0630498.1 hypothetical protein [Phycisphaerales bacterium]MCI0677071.1 hypothetical protein [Phycisphaerales bacterium]
MKHVHLALWCVIALVVCLGFGSCKGGGFTHVVTKDTAYYIDGPQQARPQDGTLTVGTKVRLVESGSSYSLIEKPVNGYVFTGDLQPLE